MSDANNIIIQEVGSVTVLTTNFIPLVSTIGTGSSGSGSSAWSDITGKPVGIVSSSTQAAAWTVATASIATSASYATNAQSANTAISASWAPSSEGASTSWASVTGKPDNLVSSSLQATSWTTATASVANAVDFGAVLNKPVIFSSSVQLPAGIISSSAQLPGNIVSSSTQATAWTVATASIANAVEFSNVLSKPALLSGSTVPTASVANAVAFTNVTGVPSLVSGSSQISYNGITNVPANIVSSSTQVAYSGISGVSTGILSSSTQINALTNTSASFAQSASLANAVQFASVLNKPVIFSASAQLPANIVSSSTQATTWTVASASLATTASFVATPFTVNVSVTNPSASIQTGYVTSFDIPANCYLNKVRIRSVSSGSIAFDIRRATLAGWGSGISNGTSITGSTAVSMSNSQTFENSTLTGWTRNLQADDSVNVFVTSVSGTTAFNNATLTLFLTRV